MQEEFSEIMNRLSENARFALQKADYYSKRYNNGYMGTEHLLLGIMSIDMSTGAKMIRDEGATLEEVEKALNKAAVEVPGSDMAMMSLSEAVILTLRMAQNYIREQGLSVIGTEHILYALLSQPNSRASLILTGLKVDTEKLLNEIEDLVEEQTKDEKLKAEKAKYLKKTPLKFLNRYGKDLTEEAKAGKLDTVIGRENEIERVVTVLSRRTKSNPVLIGEAGVGKTAIVEGLATRIANNEVPGNLIGKHIYQVDLSSVVAGTKFRGEFEERIKGIIDEATGDDSVLLFIDEIHLLSGAGSSEGSMDAANILKPALARNSINLIGATTLDEYRKSIEKDKALSRRFQTVMVEEPSAAVTLRILKGIKKHYEKHHGVVIPDEILETAITMSQRYINDRFMPDKVIDVIDEASAIAKVAADKKGGGKYKKLKIEKTTLENKISDAAEKEDYEKAANLKTELAKLEQEIKKLEKAGVKETENPILTEENLATAVSLKTGIPVSKVHGSEMKMLVNLEDELKKSIIGQDEAVAAVAKAIRRGRSGIADAKRPIGSFLFMGPTGVGKTELARVIAREVFGGENALVKIDMSEFGEKHNVSRLVGAPAGYIGYDDGGKLTEAVRRKPYSVILFDEIEKAHPDVFNLLLQILEDGVLTDGQGSKIKFNNTIVILTSNLGSADMFRESELGFAAKTAKDKKALAEEYEENKSYAMKALKKVMRPELINRLDNILVFHALTRKNVERIFDNLINDLKKRLATKGIGLKIDEKAKNYLIEEGYDPKNGARPLRRKIEDEVESLVSEEIIAEGLKKGDIPTLKLVNKKLKLVKE
ncbi:ATP-dependent Clp protease ATP-binding subunit [Candidatus Nanosyncoccus alces]|uniref:ATP-dependent Clp protease ATP-binding subunit ClpC n=1 Tax=Candidatus Nanosyncoccus alces TaxID=2171997 RepID=A0ABY0FP31_9BACT|nr:ATP-dependent Clp protease ATP-binding subunit [Candidatus Nanosyncoccus alces]RYC75124.1 ATP-dependent Clp protease ATP-binding subunit ClpC [Candidatus Nanosyncoccus alces]